MPHVQKVTHCLIITSRFVLTVQRLVPVCLLSTAPVIIILSSSSDNLWLYNCKRSFSSLADGRCAQIFVLSVAPDSLIGVLDMKQAAKQNCQRSGLPALFASSLFGFNVS